jgi:myo-inositol-1(or 4)-monophosphatase
MSLNLHPMINVAVKAARAAGNIINRAALDVEAVRISQKQVNDFVTEVDQAAEAAIIETLLTAYPGHGILAEESGSEHGAKDSDYVWIIDPLDGTTNFIHGLPVYCVSIALSVKGKIEQAVVYDPTRNDLFTATKGRGAYLNDRRLRVSKRIRLQECLISTGFPFRPGDDFKAYLAMMNEVMPKCAGLRRPGAAALDLAYVAAGYTDGFFEAGLQTWDMAAGSLLVTEAGGLVGNFTGEADFLDHKECLAGSPKIYGQLVSILGKYSKFAGVADKAAALAEQDAVQGKIQP